VLSQNAIQLDKKKIKNHGNKNNDDEDGSERSEWKQEHKHKTQRVNWIKCLCESNKRVL